MRDKMRIGDMVLYYHSNTKPPHIAGIARICKESYPDITQFDRKSKYYDPKATEETPRWFLVDMEPVSKLEEMVTLDQLKDNSALEEMLVNKRGQRLSVQPVEKQHFDEVCRMANIHL
jgi:predicted RNA-binding protein with PUA-like domain